MNRFNLPLTQELGDVDPQGGVLVVTSYWRPRPSDPNPDHPGEKLTILALPADRGHRTLPLWQWQAL